MDELTFRPATLDDLPLLLYWDEQPHVVMSDNPDDDGWEYAADLANPQPFQQQIIAQLDGRPVGFLQILDPQPEPTQYWGEVGPGIRALDIWLGEASDLGRGYGTRMMQWAFQQCFADPEVHTILVDPLVSNTKAHRFYERLGMKRIERRMFGDDDCYVYRLMRVDWRV